MHSGPFNVSFLSHFKRSSTHLFRRCPLNCDILYGQPYLVTDSAFYIVLSSTHTPILCHPYTYSTRTSCSSLWFCSTLVQILNSQLYKYEKRRQHRVSVIQWNNAYEYWQDNIHGFRFNKFKERCMGKVWSFNIGLWGIREPCRVSACFLERWMLLLSRLTR